ncbi:MAG: hypothetical protein JRG76_15080 [Deltaproteobacteria bacterium]|nr:hypothetical protein [Deltaproteobacteria bacterium]
MSGEIAGDKPDLSAVTDREAAAQSGVAHGDVLLAFSEAAVTGTEEELSSARSAVVDAMGEEAMVDAAAIIGNFQRMVRIADSTGIPLDAPLAAFSAGVRADIGIDDFGSARNTRKSGPLGRAFARLVAPIAVPVARMLTRRMMPAGDRPDPGTEPPVDRT